MKKKNDDQDILVVSELYVEANNFEKRYKALKKTIKNIRKFKEIQITGKIAEA